MRQWNQEKVANSRQSWNYYRKDVLPILLSRYTTTYNTFPVPGVLHTSPPLSLVYTLSSVRNSVPFPRRENHCEIVFSPIVKVSNATIENGISR